MQRRMFDAKQFKHVSSDNNTTVLEHKDGHTLSIAHNKLSKDMQEQLKALAPKSKEPQPLYNGGEAESDDKMKLDESGAIVIPEQMPYVPPPEAPAQAPTQSPVQLSAQDVQAAQAQSDRIPGAYSPPIPTPNDSAPTGDEAATQQIAQGLAPASMPAVEPLSALGMQQKGMKAETQANIDEARALDTKSKADVKSLIDQQDAMQKLQASSEMAQKEIQSRIDASRQSVAEAKIDPEKYWTGDSNGNGSHSRWLSAIGMIIAGFNPTGHENMAISMLQKQMDANLDAQKQNLGTKKTLLEANMKELKDRKDAELMTRMQINDLTQNQLAQAAATSQSPLAAAAAKKANGILQISQAKDFDILTSNIAKKQIQAELMKSESAANQDPSKAEAYLTRLEHSSNPEDHKKATHMRALHIPGIGFANSVEDAKSLKSGMESKSNFDNKLNEMIDLRRQHKGGATLDRNAVNRGQQLSKDLLLEYKNMAKLGVLSQADEDIINAIIPPDPLAYSSPLAAIQGQDPILHKLESFKKDSDKDFANRVKLRTRSGSFKPSAGANPNEDKTATNTTGKEMTLKSGHKVPPGAKIIMKNGQWVPVSGQ